MATKMRLFVTVEDVYKALDEGIKITDKFSYSHPTKTGGKSIRLSLGRIWFNLLQPSEFPLYDEPIKENMMSKIFKKVIDEFPPEYAADYLSKINLETFRMSSYVPTTFSAKDLVLPHEVQEAKKQFQKEDITDPIVYDQKIKEIEKMYESELLKNNVRIQNIRSSGTKKGVPWGSLVISQGYVGDIEGNILGPIKTSVNDGSAPKDFYAAAAEARNGQYYKSAISAKPGYLARRITMANAGIILDDSKKDCGTKKYFHIQVDKELAGLLYDRYIVDGKVIPIGDPTKLIGQTIKLRSPLFCKSEKGICPICYGDSWKALENKNIGILAGGDLNSIALNAYMSATRSATNK